MDDMNQHSLLLIRGPVGCGPSVRLLMFLGLPLRDSALRVLARRQRPAVIQDPRCRIRADSWSGF